MSLIPERKILQKMVITEKSQSLTDVYVFQVATQATKAAIKSAVESLFAVTVNKVRTSITKTTVRHPQSRHTTQKRVKKAYVSVAPGQLIEIEQLTF